MATPTYMVSILNAASAAEAGAVLFDAGSAAGTDADLVGAALENPDALTVAELAKARLLMGEIRLGQWTTAGDVKWIFGDSETNMAAVLAALKSSNPSSQSFVGQSLEAPLGEGSSLNANGRYLHAAGASSKGARKPRRRYPSHWLPLKKRDFKGISVRVLEQIKEANGEPFVMAYMKRKVWMLEHFFTTRGLSYWEGSFIAELVSMEVKFNRYGIIDMESARTALDTLNDCIEKMSQILGDSKARLVVAGGTDTTLNVDLLLRAGKQKLRFIMFSAKDPVGRAEELEFWISIRDSLQHLVSSSERN